MKGRALKQIEKPNVRPTSLTVQKRISQRDQSRHIGKQLTTHQIYVRIKFARVRTVKRSKAMREPARR
jgi:hypothetical protein